MSRPFAAVESFFERVLERPAARLFRAHPQPVQLERRIERAMGAMRLVASGQTYVPSRYRILLHPADLEALQASDEDLPSLLADAILVRAREQGRWLLRQPDVSLVASPRIAQGDLEVDAEPLDPSLVAAAATGLRPVELGGPRPPRAPIPGTGVIDDEDVVQPPGALAAPGPSAPPKPRDTARAAIPVVAEADTPPPVLPIVPAPPPSLAPPVGPAPAPPVGPAPAPPVGPAPYPAGLVSPPPAPVAGSTLAHAPVTPATAMPPPPRAASDVPADPLAVPEAMIPRPLLPPPLVGPRATIEVLLPGGSLREVAFDGGTLTVGRGTDNDIVIADERVSRHHGRFTARHGTLVYTDLGSTNGSHVGGVRVREVALGAGDVVRLGRAALTVRPRP